MELWLLAGERSGWSATDWSAVAERAEKLESTEQPKERAGERWGEHQGERCRARWRRALQSSWSATGVRLAMSCQSVAAKRAVRLEGTKQLEGQLESDWISGWGFVPTGECAGELQ